MKLNEFATVAPSKQYNKMFENYFGQRVDLRRLSEGQISRLLKSVRNLISEHRASKKFHFSEQDPRYLQLMIMEQALTNRLFEDTTTNTMAPGNQPVNPAEKQRIKSQQLAAVQKIKDPKIASAMKKSVSGQNLSPDEQKTVAGAALGAPIQTEGAGSADWEVYDRRSGKTLHRFTSDDEHRSPAAWKKAQDWCSSKGITGDKLSSLSCRRVGGDIDESSVNEGRIDPVHAYELLRDNGWLGRDFHELNNDEVAALWAQAKRLGYKSDRNTAPGSPARMFFQYMSRMADGVAKRRQARGIKENRRVRRLSESEVQQAQVVLAAQDMVDQVQKMIEQVTAIQFKDLPALVNQVKNEIGYDQATQFNSDATTSLGTLVQSMQTSKQQLEQAVGVVTGQQSAMPLPQEDDFGTDDFGVDDFSDDFAAPDDVDVDTDIDVDFEEPSDQGLGRKRQK